MQELEDAPLTLQIARLIEMIIMDNEAINRHKNNDLQSILEQYTELRNEHLTELSKLLQGTGIALQMEQVQNAA